MNGWIVLDNKQPFFIVDTNIILDLYNPDDKKQENTIKIQQAIKQHKINAIIPTIVAFELYYGLQNPQVNLTKKQAEIRLKEFEEIGFTYHSNLTKEMVNKGGEAYFEHNSKVAMETIPGWRKRKIAPKYKRTEEYYKNALSAIDAMLVGIAIVLKEGILATNERKMHTALMIKINEGLAPFERIKKGEKALTSDGIVGKFIGRSKRPPQ